MGRARHAAWCSSVSESARTATRSVGPAAVQTLLTIRREPSGKQSAATEAPVVRRSAAVQRSSSTSGESSRTAQLRSIASRASSSGAGGAVATPGWDRGPMPLSSARAVRSLNQPPQTACARRGASNGDTPSRWPALVGRNDSKGIPRWNTFAPGQHRTAGEPARARLHELRRPDDPERAPVGAHRRSGAAVLPAGRRARRDVLGHRERVPARHSEEVVGPGDPRYSRREEIVLATKVLGRMHDGPGGEGLSARRFSNRWMRR